LEHTSQPFYAACSVRRWSLRCWRWLAAGCLVAVALLAVAHAGVEPVNGLLLAWAYAPKVWVAVVLGIVALPGWFWGRRLGVALLAAAILWAGPVLGWRWGGASEPGPAGARPLRVLTCNRGESNGHDFSAFVARRDPDIMVLQQSRSLGAWRPDAAELATRPHGAQVGEFVIRSRFPIVSHQLLVAGVVVAKSGPRQVAPGLRCVVDAGGLGHIVVYNVHLPSPRQVLRDMGIDSSRAWSTLALRANEPARQRYWDMHRECVRLLRESMRVETLPTLAMGDWNQPDHGALYREMTDGLLDAHREAGSGYGFTFPDDVSSVLAGGRPWLRIDYILASRDWRVVDCEVEGDAGQAQHRALAAVLTPVK
jgi:endonuclease/exonuclease/phosphatase family metal-dependent hydrolase